MIKLEHLSDMQIKELGKRVGEAFYMENDGVVTLLAKDDVIKAFEIMTEYYYRAGVLYAISNDLEGLLAYWHKKDKMRLRPLFHMVIRMLRQMRFNSLVKLAKNSPNLYEKIYKKEKDYVLVSMIVIFPQYQGKGYLRKILDTPFKEAKLSCIPCVLDTDTELKMKKYASCGMELKANIKLKSGVNFYAMEYRNSQKNKIAINLINND